MQHSDSFEEATQRFFDVATWLDESEAPAMTGLMEIARSLDKRMSAAMMGEYTKVYRYLRNLKPDGATIADELEDFLSGL